MNELDKFLKSYETATNTHDFNNVAPMLTENAVYWFTDGTFEGHPAIRIAFESAWNSIKNEVYTISDVEWAASSNTAAVCIYTFSWQGDIDGTRQSGSGRGTNVIVKTDDGWQISHEHLSRLPG